MLSSLFPTLAIFQYEGKESPEHPISLYEYRSNQALTIETAILKVNSASVVDRYKDNPR
jgi:hypothetical protein